MRQLDHDPEALLGMEEGLHPVGVLGVLADDVVSGPAHLVEGLGEVGHLVGVVVRAGPIPVQEPPEKVASLTRDRFQDLDLGARFELHLTEIEHVARVARLVVVRSTDPLAAQLIPVPDEVVPGAVGHHGEVVHGDLVDCHGCHGLRSSRPPLQARQRAFVRSES